MGTSDRVKGGHKIMQKIIIVLLFTSMLIAGGLTRDYLVQETLHIDSLNNAKVCAEYRFESEKFLKKAYTSENYDISRRYLVIANQFLNKYGNCVVAFNKHQQFQGYRRNPYYK